MISETQPAEDNVRVQAWDAAEVRREVPEWDDLDRAERANRVEDVEPITEETTHNVTCIDLHERHAAALDPETPASGSISHLAFGDDETAPSSENRELNNEVYRTTPTEVQRDATSIRVKAFIDTGMANDLSLLEVGLVSTDDPSNADDQLWNHSLLPDPEGRLDPKTPDVIFNVYIDLEWRDAA